MNTIAEQKLRKQMWKTLHSSTQIEKDEVVGKIQIKIGCTILSIALGIFIFTGEVHWVVSILGIALIPLGGLMILGGQIILNHSKFHSGEYPLL